MTIPLSRFIIAMVFLYQDNYATILLQDKEYYSVDEDDLGEEFGSVITYTTIVSLPLVFLGGFVYDKMGRRYPMIVTIFIISVTVSLFPYGGSVYPGFFLIFVVNDIALEIFATSPILADYVEKSTKGIAGTYLQLGIGIGALVFSFGLLEIAEEVDLAYVSYATGIVCFCVFIYQVIFVKDVF